MIDINVSLSTSYSTAYILLEV